MMSLGQVFEVEEGGGIAGLPQGAQLSLEGRACGLVGRFEAGGPVILDDNEVEVAVGDDDEPGLYLVTDSRRGLRQFNERVAPHEVQSFFERHAVSPFHNLVGVGKILPV